MKVYFITNEWLAKIGIGSTFTSSRVLYSTRSNTTKIAAASFHFVLKEVGRN